MPLPTLMATVSFRWVGRMVGGPVQLRPSVNQESFSFYSHHVKHVEFE